MIPFLCRAKKATYAGNGPRDNPSRPASHDLSYREGEQLLYIDTYLGGERFSGEEAVWIGGTPVWAMNYTGRVTDEGFSGDFLREALSQVSESLPYRGPRRYENGAYAFAMDVEGAFDWFNGAEKVLRNGETVYECRFHGGAVK